MNSPSSAQSVEPLWSATPDGIACRKEFEISQGQPRFDVEFNPTTEHYHRDNGIGFICIATDTEWQLWQKAWRAAASAQATVPYRTASDCPYVDSTEEVKCAWADGWNQCAQYTKGSHDGY